MASDLDKEFPKDLRMVYLFAAAAAFALCCTLALWIVDSESGFLAQIIFLWVIVFAFAAWLFYETEKEVQIIKRDRKERRERWK